MVMGSMVTYTCKVVNVCIQYVNSPYIINY